MVIIDALRRDAVQKPLHERRFEELLDRYLHSNKGTAESISAISEVAVIGAGSISRKLRKEQNKKYGVLRNSCVSRNIFYRMRMAMCAYYKVRICDCWCSNVWFRQFFNTSKDLHLQNISGIVGQ